MVADLHRTHNPESSSGQDLLKLFRFGLPADTRGRPSGIRKVLIFHWRPLVHQVSHPTNSQSIVALAANPQTGCEF